MSAGSVPDILSFSRLSRKISDLKSRADTTRTEAVTGRYEDLTAHLKGDVGGAQLLKKALDDAKAYGSLLSQAELRAQTTQYVLSSTASAANGIGSAAVAAFKTNDGVQLEIISEQARGALTSLFSDLNATLGGRTLFSGDATNSPALAAPETFFADMQAIFSSASDTADLEAQLDAYFNDPAGGFETNIYLGGDGKTPDVELSPGVRINASAKANDAEIKDLMRGLAELAFYDGAGFSGAESTGWAGAERVLTAEANLTTYRAAIGVSESRIAAAKERYANEETVLARLYNAKTARDPYEAASELQLLESQLEASYLLSVRLGRLSLTNYMR